MRRATRLLMLTFVFAIAGQLIHAENNNDVVKVEEQWELVISDPDENSTGPQVVTVISPNSDVSGYHATFLFNHRSMYDFSPGGVQLILWDDDVNLDDDTDDSEELFHHENETVTWTQSVEVGEAGSVVFSLKDGNSQSFGEFGTLTLSREFDGNNLNSYNPSVSMQHSGVTFGANRVVSLKLKQVKYHKRNGTIVTDSTVRTVALD